MKQLKNCRCFSTYLSVKCHQYPPVNELEVGRFGEGVLDRGLERGHDQHDRERDHDPVREVVDVEEHGHVAGQDEEDGLQEDVEQVIDDAAVKPELHGRSREIGGLNAEQK